MIVHIFVGGLLIAPMQNRKSVRFSGPSQVVWILNLSEITPKEKDEIWWNAVEIKNFRRNAKEVIRQCPPIFSLCLKQASSRHRRISVGDSNEQQHQKGLDLNLNFWCRYNGQCRGLERMSSSLLLHCATTRRAALLSKIVRPKKRDMSDNEMRRISQKISEPARIFARQMGKSDALAACQTSPAVLQSTAPGDQREMSGLFAAAKATCSKSKYCQGECDDAECTRRDAVIRLFAYQESTPFPIEAKHGAQKANLSPSL